MPSALDASRRAAADHFAAPQYAPLSRRAAALAQIGAGSDAAREVIPFDSGHAFPDILPDLSDAAERALTVYRTETLQYGERPGLRELREWIVEFIKVDGVAASPDEVLIVNGAKHGIDLLCRLLLDDGDAIIVTAPTYFTSIPIFRSAGAVFVEAPMDSEGIVVDAIEEKLAFLKREGRKPPKFIYDVPDFHNPTGVTMSRRRRERLLDLAEQHGLFVIEDSPYRRIRFEGEDQPSLKSLDHADRVLGLGTFSKLVAPGLRIGWVNGPRDLLQRMAQLKSDGGSSPLLQRTIAEFCKSGRLSEHTKRVQQTYRNHRDRMVGALRRDIPEAAIQIPEGGYYIWLTFPAHVDGDELAQRAQQNGVAIIPGSKFFAGEMKRHPRNEGAPTNHARLAFSHAAPDEIDEGVKRLAAAYATIRGSSRHA